MKKIMFLYFFVLMGCSQKYSTNVKGLIDSRSVKDNQIVDVRGYVYAENVNVASLYTSKQGEYVDLTFAEDLIIDKQIELEKYTCIDVIGEFREYDDEFVGLGQLTSDYGLIEAKKISRCK